MKIFKKKKTLTVQTMKSIEQKILDAKIPVLDSADKDIEYAEYLGLQLQYDDLPEKDLKSKLVPPTKEGYNGAIIVDEDYRTSRLAIVHEIAHYIFDVGIGKRVVKEYCCSKKGKTPDNTEQETNYTAIAMMMPMDDIIKAIKKYDKDFLADEIAFVDDLKEKYHQDETTVLRRITECRRLMLDCM